MTTIHSTFMQSIEFEILFPFRLVTSQHNYFSTSDSSTQKANILNFVFEERTKLDKAGLYILYLVVCFITVRRLGRDQDILKN